MQAKQHLLIVDDDREIADLLGKFLRQHDYTVSVASNGAEMLLQLAAQRIDLIILDVMMPGEDGLSLCKRLRQSSSTPIIMLTAMSEEVERILGLELGADDYMSKPFNSRELLARIRAVLRRVSHDTVDARVNAAPDSQSRHIIYRFNQWRLHSTTRQLLSPENLEISLSSGEFELLLLFLRMPQQVLSRDTLLDATKNRVATPFDRSIDIQISRLRHKLEVDHNKPSIIKTVRGGGYMLAVAVTKEHLTPCA